VRGQLCQYGQASAPAAKRNVRLRKMRKKLADIYIDQLAPIVNGLFLLVPFTILLIMHDAYRDMVDYVRTVKQNLPPMTYSEFDFIEIAVLIIIFGV
jgi:hypothetical protein